MQEAISIQPAKATAPITEMKSTGEKVGKAEQATAKIKEWSKNGKQWFKDKREKITNQPREVLEEIKKNPKVSLETVATPSSNKQESLTEIINDPEFIKEINEIPGDPNKASALIDSFIKEVSGRVTEFNQNTTNELNDKLFLIYRRVAGHPRYEELGQTIQNLDNFSLRIKNLLEKKGINLSFGLANPSVYKENLLKGRKVFEEVFAPGKWLAQGAYVDDLPNILQLNGLTSSYGKIALGLKAETHERWIGGQELPDRNAIYFFSAENSKAGMYANATRGATDLAIFYPVETVLQHGEAIGSQSSLPHINDEFFVTSSENSIKKGELVSDPDDQTLLPWQDAHYVIAHHSYNRTIAEFKKHDVSDEWISTHVHKVESKSNDPIDFHRTLIQKKTDLLNELKVNRNLSFQTQHKLQSITNTFWRIV